MARPKSLLIRNRLSLSGSLPLISFWPTHEAAPQPAPLPVAAAAPAPEIKAPNQELMKETLSLLETLRDWSQKEQASAPSSKFQLDDFIPAKPLMPEPSPTVWIPPQTSSAPKKAREKIELHLTLSKKFVAVFALVALLSLSAIAMLVWNGEKMRGLESFRLPDPSSPTIQPSTKNDPIPSLKAPTRPKRD